MKKMLTLMLIFVFVFSCAIAYAGGSKDTASKAPLKSAGSGKGFFNEAADLFRVQIPETKPNKSNNLWNTDKQKAACAGKK